MKANLTLAVGSVLMIWVAPVSGAVIAAGDVGTAAPPSTLGPYAMTFFPEDPQPETTIVPSVASPLGGMVGFTPSLEHYDIPLIWAVWSHGYQGDVYWTLTSHEVLLTMPAGTKAFVFYVQPSSFGAFVFTATTQDGTDLTQAIFTSGTGGGAQYFGFYASGADVIQTIHVEGPIDFAVGEFSISNGAQVSDLDGDGDVDGFDLALLLGAWGACPQRGPCPADLDGNGAVNGFDLAILLAAWS